MRILRVVHENFPWRHARRSSYAIHQGIDEVLRRLGHEVITFNGYYAPHLPSLMAGRYFDQIWWDLNQTHREDQRIGGWMAHAAPVRLGLFPESLSYDIGEVEGQEHVLRFRAWVDRKLPFLTHLSIGDEHDVEPLQQRGVKVRWMPQGVPHGLMQDAGPGHGVFFFGTPYGKRRAWLEELNIPAHPSSEVGSLLPSLFNLANRATRVITRFPVPGRGLARVPLMKSFSHLRRQAYLGWLQTVGKSRAVVSLPSVFKAYPGRVTEALSQARAVIAWRVPSRPRNLSLFEDGKEILLYSDFEELKELVRRVELEPAWAREVGRAGLARMRSCYSLEGLLEELVQWTSTRASQMASTSSEVKPG